MGPTAAQTRTENSNANSDWQVCNETSFVLRVATASLSNGKVSPEGWTQIRSGACFTKSLPIGTPRYLYAESSTVHVGKIREWKGNVTLCTGNEDFKASVDISCALQNLQERDYLQVDPSERITSLIETDGFGKKAETAGLQRLLQDNGYKISRVDGLSGRRTTQTLSKFLKDNNLAKSLSKDKKFDALIAAAAKHKETIGLRLCNKSSQTAWIAIAMRNESQWESRGWWPLKPTECERPITKSLKDLDAHFFALQEQPSTDDKLQKDKRLRTVVSKPEEFCIGESVFSALGNTYCEDRGYTAQSFRPIITEEIGININLTDADFVQATIPGLRR
ncbi:MAG: DUF1036 domain-containing protein [Maricaulaceae bacterium]